jgi:sugar lactone lactonase YvrE
MVGWLPKWKLKCGLLILVSFPAKAPSANNGLMKKSIFSILLAVYSASLLYVPAAHAQVITTVAGTGEFGYNGDGIPAAQAQLSNPFYAAIDSKGNIYIADSSNHRIRKVDANTGLISTIAGTGEQGYNGDGIPAVSAQLDLPFGIAIDSSDNIYIADGSFRLRKVDASTGLISTIAGTGSPVFGSFEDGVPATAAVIAPSRVTFDKVGNIYIVSDTVIRRIDAASGLIFTVAGQIGREGYNGDGIPATSALLDVPADVAVDSIGNIYIADSFNERIRKVDAATRLISTVAGTGVGDYNGDNIPAVVAQLSFPLGVAVDSDGSVYIADSGNSRIRKVDAVSGLIATVAGTGRRDFNGDNIPAIEANLDEPVGIALGSNGDFYIADVDHRRVRKVARACPVSNNLILAQQTPPEPPKVLSVKIEKPEGTFSGPLNGPIDDNPSANGGGKRIFPDADSPTGDPKREVWVTVQTDRQAEVFIRSFDVNDSSGLFSTGQNGNDNQGPSVRSDGIPKEGGFKKKDGANEPIIVGQIVKLMTDECGMARIKFVVTMQPGDNFRIAVGTKEDVVNSLVVNGQNVIDPSTPSNPLPEEQVGNGADAVMSKMLTVWRYLHVEVDSMSAPPASDTDPERNFIKGNIIGIESSQLAGQGRVATKLILEPMSPPLVNGLRDGSPDLDGKANPNFAKGEVSMGKGRFENGTITVGTNSPITSLDGNGQFFVQKETGLNIAFSLADDNNQNMISGSITELDSKKKEFTLNQDLKGDAKGYAGGKLTVAGMTFTVAKVNGSKAEVVEDNKLPFMLVDDDKKQPPFLQKPTTGENGDITGFLLMQNSDDQNLNLYAAAYIQPVYDLSSDTNVKFSRNFVDDQTDFDQLVKGQTFSSTPDFFVVYIQGAFQGPAFLPLPDGNIGDGDPNSEGSGGNVLGVGRTLTNLEQGTLKGGSLIFRESILELTLIKKLSEFLCLDFTVIHETGHQWGLEDGTGGIMNRGCADTVTPVFIPEHLRIIRMSLFPQGQ